jgi:hypothetical protein
VAINISKEPIAILFYSGMEAANSSETLVTLPVGKYLESTHLYLLRAKTRAGKMVRDMTVARRPDELSLSSGWHGTLFMPHNFEFHFKP